MSKLKVMTILGTRPEIIRLAETIRACDRYFSHILVHTGQNYDDALSRVFFDDLALREPDYYLKAAGGSLGDTVGRVIERSFDVLKKEMPDALLVLGDTNSCLSAYAAKRLKIPVFHMEAGNRCFDQNVPEEINRRIIDHISDINLAYTEHARRYLLREGIRSDHVFVIGSPMPEVLHKNMHKIESSGVLRELDLSPGGYMLLSAHREENVDADRRFILLMQALNDLAGIYRMPMVFSTHPRTWKRIEEKGFSFHPLIRKLKPFGFCDYNKLQKNAFCVLSDSGTLSEESAILGFPAVLIRTSTERPEVLDKGTMVVGGNTPRDILQAVQLTREMWDNGEKTVLANDYTDGNVSVKVVKIIQSYTRIVDDVVWRKPQIES